MLPTNNIVVYLNSIKTLDLTKFWWEQNAPAEYTINGKQLDAASELLFMSGQLLMALNMPRSNPPPTRLLRKR